MPKVHVYFPDRGAQTYRHINRIERDGSGVLELLDKEGKIVAVFPAGAWHSVIAAKAKVTPVGG